MDEEVATLARQIAQFSNQSQLLWIPIRHHSPACSLYLSERLESFNPDILLIEGASDYASKIPVIASETTIPPIAIYSKHLFYPLCDTSPEYRAIVWGVKNTKDIRFIDLPIGQKVEQKSGGDLVQPLSEQNESQLQHSDYVQRLVKKFGCRNSDELWERLFELKRFDSAEQFFERVFGYCAASRLTYSEEALLESGDLVRESYMRKQIKRAVQTGKVCCVITGGFHTPALFEFDSEFQPDDSNDKHNSAETWLIRYSDDRLDALNGYSAGMQAPRFYDRLLAYREMENAHSTQLSDLVFAYIDDLTSQNDSLEINTAMKIALCNQITSLASLRDNAYPGLFDVKDAIASVLIKRERTPYDPVLNKAHELLAGVRLGSLDADQASIPLVSDLYGLLKKAKFKLEKTTPVTTQIKLYQIKGNAKQRLELLNQCLFVDIGFAQKVSGPNWEMGYELERQNEEWRYAWTPWVEANLIDRSLNGPDWGSLLQYKIDSAVESLDDKLVSAQRLFTQLVLMGNLDLVPNYWDRFCDSVTQSSEPQELAGLILLLLRLTRFETALLDDYRDQFKQLVLKVWDQLLFCLPSIGKLEQTDALRTLIQTQEVTREIDAIAHFDWKQQWLTRLAWLIEFGQLSVDVRFACRALLVEQGEGTKELIFQDLEQLFSLQPSDAYQALQGVITVMPSWILASDNRLLILLNDLLHRWDEQVFGMALPDLRLIFSHMEPVQVEKISQRICQLNDWDVEIEVFNTDVSTQEVLDAQSAYQELLAHLEKEGLGHWIKY